VTREEVLAEIQKHSQNRIALPSSRYKQSVMFGAIKHFGSWTEACDEAKVIPFRRYERKAAKKRVVEQTFKKLNQEHLKILFHYLHLAKEKQKETGCDMRTVVDGAIKAAREHISGIRG